MTDTITLTGIIATDPRALVTQTGLSITSFRLASTQRRYDRVKGEWVDGETNWYTITAFRQLAENVLTSLRKGQRVIVTGRVRIRAWESGERSGMTVEVDADAIGHDLVWGRSTFERRVVSSSGAATSASTPTGEAASGSGVEADSDSGSATDPVVGERSDEVGPEGADIGSTRDAAGGDTSPQGGPGEAPSADASGVSWGTPPAVRADEMPVPF